jgi:hypothetical protein
MFKVFVMQGVSIMTYMLLSDLSTKQQINNVKVKVMRLWESINNKIEELMSLDIILMDEKVNFNFIVEYIHIILY